MNDFYKLVENDVKELVAKEDNFGNIKSILDI
jgi:hypothetical protein